MTRPAPLALALAFALAGCGDDPPLPAGPVVDLSPLLEIPVGEGEVCRRLEDMEVIRGSDAPECPMVDDVLAAYGVERTFGRIVRAPDVCGPNGRLESAPDQAGVRCVWGSGNAERMGWIVQPDSGRATAWSRAPGADLVTCSHGRVSEVWELDREAPCAWVAYTRETCSDLDHPSPCQLEVPLP